MPQNLPDYIEITKNAKQYIDDFLNKNTYSSVFVLVDENTQKNCLPLFSSGFKKAHIISIASGEQNKTLQTCQYIWECFTNKNADRNALLINLGGGVIGDMGGFCASTYKRGIDFINIPTTLLAQVDASIGGKLAIDFNGFKNHIGLFKLPTKVVIDASFLKTLPSNEIKSGFAEMLKHAIINNKAYLRKLSQVDMNTANWQKLIKKSIEIKNEIVSVDPTEKNERKYLNFGHTIGHAVETYYLNNRLSILHGEAVALGMIMETQLSSKIGLPDNEKYELIKIINKFFRKIEIPKKGIKQILHNLLHDKKNKNSEIQAVLLKHIGNPKHSIKISTDEVQNVLKLYIFK